MPPRASPGAGGSGRAGGAAGREVGPAASSLPQLVDGALKQVAAEPSAGLHYIQDHVRRSAAGLVASEGKLREAGQEIADVGCDAEMCREALQSINAAAPAILSSTIARLNNAMYSVDVLAAGPNRR